MTQTSPTTDRPTKHVAKGNATFNATFAAAALLMTSAVLTLLAGIAALVNGDLFVFGPDFIYQLNTRAWGVVLTVLAIIVGAAAFALFWGQRWARVTAIVLAALSIVVMSLWLPYAAAWSLVVIALDIVAIWAIATWNTPRSDTER